MKQIEKNKKLNVKLKNLHVKLFIKVWYWNVNFK